jgi:hypothetical protein
MADARITETVRIPPLSYQTMALRHVRASQRESLVPNRRGHQHMLGAAGLDIIRAVRPYAIPFGPSHPASKRANQAISQRIFHRGLLGRSGVSMSVDLAQPAVLS